MNTATPTKERALLSPSPAASPQPALLSTDKCISPNRRATHKPSGISFRSIAIVVLACITVSTCFYVRLHQTLHNHILSPIHGTDYKNFLVGLPAMPEVIRDLAIGERTSSLLDLRQSTTQRVDQKQQQQYPDSSSRFAYAFVIGGCNPDYVPSYQNYLFNILVAAQIFKERGSKSDVVALFQVSGKAKRTRLPDKDARLLHALGVHVYYIPQQKTGVESFYRTQLDKFRILGLTQYERVLFMDGDVMPLANLDYLFEYSVNGTLEENLVTQGVYEPANGGFFMLSPGHLEQANDIVQWRERTGKAMRYPFFDEVVGWGQPLSPEDPWVSQKKKGTNYTFLAAFADQGLLFHYTKYARQSVSIVLRQGAVENWAALPQTLPNGTRTMVVQKRNVLDAKVLMEASQTSNLLQVPGLHNRLGVPLNSIVHFTGSFKPWLRGGAPKDRNSTQPLESPKRYWFHILAQLDKDLNIGLDFENHWSSGHQRPPLGMYPVYGHILNASSNLLTPLERDYPTSPQDYRIL